MSSVLSTAVMSAKPDLGSDHPVYSYVWASATRAVRTRLSRTIRRSKQSLQTHRRGPLINVPPLATALIGCRVRLQWGQCVVSDDGGQNLCTVLRLALHHELPGVTVSLPLILPTATCQCLSDIYPGRAGALVTLRMANMLSGAPSTSLILRAHQTKEE